MPNEQDVTLTLNGETDVTLKVVVRSKHLVVDRLWTRNGPGNAWGKAKHTGDTDGDDRDSFTVRKVMPGHELLYHLVAETVNAEASSNFDIEVTLANGETPLAGGRLNEKGPLEQGVAVVERLVRFQ